MICYFRPMKTAGIHELKQELNTLPHAELMELCLRLARFKKENKELLTYLLFEAHDTEAYITAVKAYIDEEFITVPVNSLYFMKKALRKILKAVNKYIKYTGSKQAEIELLVYFCSKIKKTGVAIESSTVLHNLYKQQLIKAEKAIATQHEDLQYDYRRLLKEVI